LRADSQGDPAVPGLWGSPVSPHWVASGLRLSDVAWDGDTLLWLEGRSERGVLVARDPHDADRDLTSDLSVRAGVGYGGGDFTAGGGWVVFASGGRLYRRSHRPGSDAGAVPVTPAWGVCASPALSPDGRWVAYVHSADGVDSVAAVDAAGRQWPRRLAAGSDFYMQPCWHPSGSALAYVCWDHPHMPWERSRLCVLPVDEGTDGLPVPGTARAVAGGDSAVLQPRFTPDGREIVYACDETGWWNLYAVDPATGRRRALTAHEGAEAGRPAWVQGVRTFALSGDGRRVYYLLSQEGVTDLWEVGLDGGGGHRVDGPLLAYTDLSQIAAAPGGTGRLALIASADRVPPRIVTLDVPAGRPARAAVVRRSMPDTVDASRLAAVRPLRWTGSDGAVVHGLYWAPAGGRLASGAAPPAIVRVHGGPTAQASAAFSEEAQFFATRGYAVLDVNHRGSSGYGRAYREALDGRWGVVDVEDAVAGGRHLAEATLADPGRLVIMGGSAGGYTVLRALVTHPGFFRAAVCRYGISNLFTLAAETHKFEARYLDSLIGPLPASAAVYRERSPLFSADRIRDAVAIFQGGEDRVVPIGQAEAIVAALRAGGVPHEYHVYPNEGHGWRRAETVEAYYSAVDAFLRRYVVLG
jgi:dipeptidyl aminopeptidase/acylaminoacyl peptidase